MYTKNRCYVGMTHEEAAMDRLHRLQKQETLKTKRFPTMQHLLLELYSTV